MKQDKWSVWPRDYAEAHNENATPCQKRERAVPVITQTVPTMPRCGELATIIDD